MADFISIANDNSAFNAAEAQKNRDFQAAMSNTAHQREVADLKAAGLSPVLSANSGATTPGGSQAQADTSANSAIAAVAAASMSAGAMVEAARINAGASVTNTATSAIKDMYNSRINNPYGAVANLANEVIKLSHNYLGTPEYDYFTSTFKESVTAMEAITGEHYGRSRFNGSWH